MASRTVPSMGTYGLPFSCCYLILNDCLCGSFGHPCGCSRINFSTQSFSFCTLSEAFSRIWVPIPSSRMAGGLTGTHSTSSVLPRIISSVIMDTPSPRPTMRMTVSSSTRDILAFNLTPTGSSAAFTSISNLPYGMLSLIHI